MATRSGFDAALESLTIEFGHLADEVRVTLNTAVTAFLEQDRELSAQAATIENRIIERSRELDQRCATLLATQSPVAGDLRLIVSMIRLAAELDRSAHLAGHIARQAATIDGSALPTGLRDLIAHIASLVDTVYGLAITAFRSRDETLATAISAADDRVDEAVALLTDAVVRAGDGHSLSAIDVMNLGLLARYLERIADHAVGMARRTLFLMGESA